MITLLRREITFWLSQCMRSQSTNVTDWRTDGRTDDIFIAIPRYVYVRMLRVVKTKPPSYGIDVLQCFRDTRTYRSQIANFYSMSVGIWTCFSFEKTSFPSLARLMGQADVERFVLNNIGTWPTDGQTDRRKEILRQHNWRCAVERKTGVRLCPYVWYGNSYLLEIGG